MWAAVGAMALAGLLSLRRQKQAPAALKHVSVPDDAVVSPQPPCTQARPALAVFSSSFDPISSGELRMAAELCNLGKVDAVLLAPFGRDYSSIDKRHGGLTVLSRIVLAHVGVESTLPASCPVSVINPSMHTMTTDEIHARIIDWATQTGREVLWVAITNPDRDGMCEVSLAARPQASPTAAPPTRALGLSRTLSTNGYFPAVGGLAGSNFVDRMRSASQFSVYGLVPPLVMSAIKRYGLYHSSPTVPHQSEGWYCNGWSMFSGIPHSASTPLESEAGCSSDGNDDPAESDVISRSCSDVIFLSPAKAGDRTPSRPGKRRVALFGGSFSPIAVHHLEIAAELVNTNEADEVWVIPCGPRPDKPSLDVCVFSRYLQCVLAIESFVSASVPIYVVPTEVPHTVALPSYVLATALPRCFPSCVFEVVIGSDLVSTLHKWQYAHRLLAEVSFVVSERPGVPYAEAIANTAPELLPPSSRIRLMSLPRALKLSVTSLSSTELRSRFAGASSTPADVRSDWSLAGLLPLPVLSFVNRYGMYGLCATGAVMDTANIRPQRRAFVLQ